MAAAGDGQPWVETNSGHAGAKKAPRREGRRGAKQRAWAGGQIKRAEQLKHGWPDLVPLQTHFFQKNFAALESRQVRGWLHVPIRFCSAGSRLATGVSPSPKGK